MLNEIEHNVMLIFLLQLVSIIEKKQYFLILNLIEVSLIIVHLITIKLDCYIFHTKLILLLYLLVKQLAVFGQKDFWIVIYVYNLKKTLEFSINFILLNYYGIRSLNLFDVYIQYRNYKKGENQNSNEFFIHFNINHQEIKNLYKTQKFVKNQNKEKNTIVINQNYINEAHYQIFQVQDSIPNLKDLFYPEWKKTYFCQSTEELLQYILYSIYNNRKNNKEIYRVQITRNKAQDYILSYTKLDSLLYFRMRGSKKRFRNIILNIFTQTQNSIKLSIGKDNINADLMEMCFHIKNLQYQQKSINNKNVNYYVNSDSMTFQTFHVTLNQIIQNVRELIREECKAKIIVLQTDQLKLERILYNLLNNAYRHSNQKGAIYLTVELIQGTLHFSVRNSGLGISKKIMADYNLQFYYHQNPSNSIKRIWNHKLGTTLLVTNKLVHLLNGNNGHLEILQQNESEFKFSILQELNINREYQRLDLVVQVQIDLKQIQQQINKIIWMKFKKIVIQLEMNQKVNKQKQNNQKCEIDNYLTIILEQTFVLVKQKIIFYF